MIEYLKFWLAKGLIEFAVGVIVLLLLFMILVSPDLLKFRKQNKCNHVDYYENGRCDAICRHCGKNLGFIRDVRNQRNKT